MTKYPIELAREQREKLEKLIRRGKERARKIAHAQVLLKADRGPDGPGWSDEHIQEAFGVSLSTIRRIGQRFVESGLDDALNRRAQPPRPEKRILNGRHEAYLIALSCGQKPEGRERWSVRLLAHKMVEVGYVEQVGRETICVALKKMNSNPG